MSVFQSLYAVGMFAGPVVVGVMADTAGLGAGFWLCGLAGLLGLSIAWRFVGPEN